MMIETNCPHCGKRYRLEDQHAGRTGKCKACGGRFEVPKAEPAQQAAASDEYGLAEEPNNRVPPIPPEWFERTRQAETRLSALDQYRQLPWYRRGGIMGPFAWAGLLFCGISMIPVGLVCMTGNIYYKPRDREIHLHSWPAWNRPFFIVLMLLVIALLGMQLLLAAHEMRRHESEVATATGAEQREAASASVEQMRATEVASSGDASELAAEPVAREPERDGEFRRLFDKITSSGTYGSYHDAYDRGLARAKELLDELKYEYRPGELTGEDVSNRIATWLKNYESIRSQLANVSQNRKGLTDRLMALQDTFTAMPEDVQQGWLSQLHKSVQGDPLSGAKVLGKSPVRPMDDYQAAVEQLREWHEQAQKDLPFIDPANEAHAAWREVADHNQFMRERLPERVVHDEGGRAARHNANVDRRAQITRNHARMFLEGTGARAAINSNDADQLLQHVPGSIGRDLQRWLEISESVDRLNSSHPKEAAQRFTLERERELIEHDRNIDRGFFARFQQTLAWLRTAKEAQVNAAPQYNIDNEAGAAYTQKLLNKPTFGRHMGGDIDEDKTIVPPETVDEFE